VTRSTESLRAFMASSQRTVRPPAFPWAIAVGAGKGGVGTSSVAALLAVEEARAGERVLLVDAVDGVGSQHLIFGRPDPGATLDALQGGGAQAEDLVVHVDPNLHLFPSGGVPEAEMSAAEGRALRRRVTRLFERYSVVILDVGSGMSSARTASRYGVGRLLCVTTPERIALAASYAVFKVVRSGGTAIAVTLLVNGATESDARGVHATVRAATKNFLGTEVGYAGAIPSDELLSGCIEAGTPLPDLDPSAPSAEAASGIVRRLRADVRAPVPSDSETAPISLR